MSEMAELVRRMRYEAYVTYAAWYAMEVLQLPYHRAYELVYETIGDEWPIKLSV